MKITCLNENYSTTRLLTKIEPPIFINKNDKFTSTLYVEEMNTIKAEGGLRKNGYFKKRFTEKPLISIITVVYNGEKYLEQTILSVISQNYDNIEYIIIDGGSTDGTLDIIKKYDEQIDYWISETDNGIYDAMNKGIKLAQGEFIGLINADDYYEKDIFHKVVKEIKNNKYDIIFGHCKMIDLNGNIKLSKSLSLCEKYKLVPCSMSLLWFGMIFNHPSSFISMKAYKTIGLYSLDYKIVSDYKLLLDMYRKNITFIQLDKTISSFREGGISTYSAKSILTKEMQRVWLSSNFIIGSFIILIKFLLHTKNKIKYWAKK